MTITVTNKTASTNNKNMTVYQNYIVVTGLDTTATYDGPVIDMSAEDIIAVYGTAVCTASSGAANLAILLLGGNKADGSDLSILQSTAAANITSGNIAIASPTVTGYFDTVKTPRQTFPPYMAVRYTLSANGWTGTISLSFRKSHGTVRA